MDCLHCPGLDDWCLAELMEETFHNDPKIDVDAKQDSKDQCAEESPSWRYDGYQNAEENKQEHDHVQDVQGLNDQPRENKVPVEPDDTDKEKDVGDDPGDEFNNGAVAEVLHDPVIFLS